MALSWKFLEDVAKEGIGTNEVEMKAWIRSANQEVKKGKERPTLDKGRYDLKFRRDRKYIGNEMKLRVEQAREDWSELRSDFMEMKARMLRNQSKTEGVC